MRFDLLLAILSSGIYAPLALMAGGFIVAVGGLAAFLWRRKKAGAPVSDIDKAPGEALETEAEDEYASISVPAAAPEAPEGRRRRSLVSGAERETGTPAGELRTDEDADVEAPELNTLEDVAVFDAQTDASGEEPSDTVEAEWTEAEPEDLTEEPSETTQVALARANPIVFRQFMPQSPQEDGLSFYGGEPIGPSDFEWPRQEGTPLTFIMQWDCMQLASQDATGLLPKDGVLYCFLNLSWGEGDGNGHAFIHCTGPTDGWAPISPPDDAPAIFGSEGAWQVIGCTSEVDNADDYVPRIMPHFPFDPVAFDYPINEAAKEQGEHRFWSDGVQTAEALLAVEQRGKAEPSDIPDIETPHQPFARPFPAFPHDFGAIRVIAAKMIEVLSHLPEHKVERLFPDLSKDEREALFASWKDEAKEVYMLGTQRPIGHRVEQNIADDIWQWVEDRKAVIDLGFQQTVLASVELSLCVGSSALGSIPDEMIERAMSNHVLAREYMVDESFGPDKHGSQDDWLQLKEAGKLERVRAVMAPAPARIFGPPSYVQGYVEEMVDDHILLLELPGGGGPGHHFGEGVLQYMIAPEDLAAGRFDQVKSVISAY
ncbi:DUF1963 domain-containing protein [Erythrobacter longus]|nr:DUF1963 domain-containing protein [Erythrobacter longus]